MQATDRRELCCRSCAEVSCEDNNHEDLKNKSVSEPYDPDQDYLNKVNAAQSLGLGKIHCKHIVEFVYIEEQFI